MKTLLIDNYDSFTFNLFHLLAAVNREDPIVVRNDEATWAELERLDFDNIVISPGPGRPDRNRDVGVSLDALERAEVPVLGVCLGHQALAAAFGGKVVRGEPVHGKAGEVEHDGRTIFAGLESPIVAGRYHSLVVDPDLPDELERSASLGETVMAIRHRELPAEGVQFHPESVLTADGMAILRNFVGPS